MMTLNYRISRARQTQGAMLRPHESEFVTMYVAYLEGKERVSSQARHFEVMMHLQLITLHNLRTREFFLSSLDVEGKQSPMEGQTSKKALMRLVA